MEERMIQESDEAHNVSLELQDDQNQTNVDLSRAARKGRGQNGQLYPDCVDPNIVNPRLINLDSSWW